MRIIILGLILIGCGVQTETVTTRTVFVESEACSVESIEEGALITCPDGTTTVVLEGQDGETIVGPAGENGQDGKDGQNGKDAETPSQSILFLGTVCNNLNVLGLVGGTKFIAYGNEVHVLSTTEATIWTQSAGAKYCKVKLNETGSVSVSYAP